METLNENFIRNTAQDYDMNYEDVKSIYLKYPRNEFYDRLEEFIKNRANRNN